MSFTRADYPPLSTISYVSTLTSVSFNPSSITGLNLWLDATDPAGTGIQPANGTTLTTWKDKSVSNFPLTTAGSAYNTTAVNGLPGISLSTNFIGYDPGSSQNNWQEIFVVGVWTGGSTFNDYNGLVTGSIDSGSDGIILIGNAGGTGWYGSGNGYQTPFLNGTQTGVALPAISTPFQIRTFTGSAVSIRGIRFGIDRIHTGRKWNGFISEVLSYNTALTATQRQQIEGYLAWKWGTQASLPGGHLHASSGPSFSVSTLTSTLNINLTGFTQSISRVINSAFSPTSITGCRLWMDGADSTTITIATGVSQWNDKSGNTYNFTQATGSLQPTRTGNYLNFQSNYYLNIPTAAINNASAYSFFFVFNPIASTNWILQKQYDGVGSYNMISMTKYWGGIGTTAYLYWTAWANPGLYANSGIALSLSTVQLIEIMFDGTTLTIYRNGNVLSTSTGSYTIPNATTVSNFTIGAWIASGNPQDSGTTNFQLGELIYYNAFLNTTQRQNVEGYLAWKWGLQTSLPVGHPYLSTNPNVTTSTVTTIYAPKSQVPLAINPYYTAFNFATLSTLALWIDGSDPLGTGVAPAQGTLLSSLIDKSGNNRAISTFSTTVGFPIYTAAANGSLGVIQLATGNGIFLSSIALTPMMSLYAVYSPINPSTGIAIEQGANALSNLGFLLTSVSTTSTIYAIGGGGAISATGGTITTAGNFKYHVFTTSGTFTLGTAATISYLIVGGGGGGGDRHGAGGGAGGVLSSTWAATPGDYTITVGAGGLRGATNEGGQTQYGTPPGAGSKGGDSSISSVATAYGGGGGGTLAGNPTDTLIGSGGGGGGGGLAGIAGTAGQGFAGGSGSNPGGGGGGGAGGAGVNADTGTGGIGTAAYSTQLLAVGYGTSFATSWTLGTSTYQTTPSTFLQSPIVGGVAYIAGGGGGNGAGGSSSNGLGGAGGGGRGDWDDTNITGGTTNTGGGGGSSRSYNSTTVGRDGGSGLVLLWYPLTIVTTATGGTVTTSGAFKIHTFTTTGNTNFILTSPASISAQVLVVGGGGAGGSAYVGGGGGAGGAVFNASFTITAGTYTVTVGAGGVRTSAGVGFVGPSGANSSFSSITGTGGGGGGSYMNVAATNGGCGGGGPFNNGQFGTGSQGGNGAPFGTDGNGGFSCGGGGGGMGGTAPTPASTRPNGGLGATYTVAGTAYTLAGGGGAGSDGLGGLGRAGGGLGGNGNNAGQTASNGGDATPNTGSGGGGGGGNNGSLYGGAGGSGIVIIAYLA